LTSIVILITDELKHDLEVFGIEVSEVARSALEKEVKRIKRIKAKEAGVKLGKMLVDVSDEDILKSSRKSLC